MRKIKFFDSVCFRGELEFLIFRLNELDSYVDNFIIADLTEDNLILSNWVLFEKWESKISLISADSNNYIELIKNKFINFNPDFEDVLMISNTDEVPDLTDKDVLLEKLKFEAFLLEHHNLIGNYEYCNNKLFPGTLVINLSLIVRTKHSVDFMKNLLSKQRLKFNFLLPNGWKFSNFKHYPNLTEQLPPTEIDPVRTYPLIKHNGSIPLPKHIDLLPYVKVGRDNIKRHLFLVESELSITDGYDTITIINFSDNFKEVLCEKVSDNTTKSILYLPNKVLYGDSDLETFQNEYMLNETKRMFSVVFPQEHDIIDVIFKNKKPLGSGGV